MNKVKALVIIPAVLVMAAACSKSATSGPKPLTVSLKEFSVTLSSLTAPAGETTFSVSNSGTTAHEFVVLKTDTPAGDFPVTSFEGESERFDEDAAGENVGETGDMQPGETKTLVINLPPGHYALVCNLPGHYAGGMHQDFTVGS